MYKMYKMTKIYKVTKIYKGTKWSIQYIKEQNALLNTRQTWLFQKQCCQVHIFLKSYIMTG